ncbi:MAG: hypothetical protein ABR985_20655 [Methanotrichaceae archaeon]
MDAILVGPVMVEAPIIMLLAHQVRRTVVDHVLIPVPTQITAVLVATSVNLALAVQAGDVRPRASAHQARRTVADLALIPNPTHRTVAHAETPALRGRAA